MVPDAIKFMRNSAGFSQKELAKRVNLSHQTLSSYEREFSRPTMKMFVEIAHACDFEVIIHDKNSEEAFRLEEDIEKEE